MTFPQPLDHTALLELVGVEIGSLKWDCISTTIRVNGAFIHLGKSEDNTTIFLWNLLDCDKLMREATILWAQERKKLQEARLKIESLETYVAQLELMPSDQTWAAATEAVESEINAIKYRTL